VLDASPPGAPNDASDPLRVEPFLKWPGGKRLLAPRLAAVAPRQFGRYYEPFLGSGALFFALRPVDALLADTNSDLIECFTQVRDNCESVIRALRRLKNTHDDYYRIRQAHPASAAGRAARFIYLVKLAFNGIYRVSRTTGNFNVPYGWHIGREVFDADNLRAASTALQRTVLMAGDFAVAVSDAKRGDLVYLDPPYTVAHSNNGFVRYNQRLFSWDDQIRVADLADRLASKGVSVIVSNAPHRSVIGLYPAFSRHRLRRPSQIAANKAFRRTVTEMVFTANV